MNEAVRAWIYRVFLAVLVVGAAFNAIQLTKDQQDALQNLVSLVVLSFPVGLAAKNTSTKPNS